MSDEEFIGQPSIASISAKSVTVTSQRWIVTAERSGLLTRIATNA
jgi:hypothetical protein